MQEVDAEIPEAFAFLWEEVADDGLAVRHRAAHGGRGSGKSHGFAQALVLKAAQTPLRVGCFREVQKSIRDSVKRLLDDKIAQCGLGSFYESTDSEIRGRNGSLFVFGGLRTNPDAVKSLEGLDIAWVEEASRVSRRSIELLIPTVRKPGSELWWGWNPENPTDPVDEMFCGPDGPPPGSIVRKVNHSENPFFPDVLLTELEYDKRRDPEKYAHIWLGEYRRNAEARVFKNWRIEAFEAAPHVTHRLGGDFGYSVDPSCAVRCHIEGRRLYIDYEAYRVGCEIDQLPDLFLSIPEAEKWPMVGDTSRPETISYLRRHGLPKIQAAVKGARSVEEGVAFLQSYDIVVHPRCVHMIDELTLYSFKTDPLTGAVLPVLEDKDNHMVDALRYALEGARRALAVAPRPASVAIPATRTAFNRR